jgi:hypothetical protein
MSLFAIILPSILRTPQSDVRSFELGFPAQNTLEAEMILGEATRRGIPEVRSRYHGAGQVGSGQRRGIQT